MGSKVLLKAEEAAHLQEGVNLVFSRWDILKTAVEKGYGGFNSHHKAQQLAYGVFSLVSRSEVYIEDVVEFLQSQMEEQFNYEGIELVDQDSIPTVALRLMYIREGCFQGDFSLIQRLKETNPPNRAVSHVIKAYNDSNDDNISVDENLVHNASSKMDVDVPPSSSMINGAEMMAGECKSLESAEVEAGWTLVTSKKTKCRRN